MGSRDHSIKCETCGLQRGGLNDLKCYCDDKIEDVNGRGVVMKSYAKKRVVVRAVQWTGVMTPEMTELVGTRIISNEGDQLVFANAKGPGRFAPVGDWIVSSSGEDLTVIGADQFGEIYEEIDETARPRPPTDAEHEAAAQSLVRDIDELLVTGMRLSGEEQPDIFRVRDLLLRKLRLLLEDHTYNATRRERHRVRDLIVKELTP